MELLSNLNQDYNVYVWNGQEAKNVYVWNGQEAKLKSIKDYAGPCVCKEKPEHIILKTILTPRKMMS